MLLKHKVESLNLGQEIRLGEFKNNWTEVGLTVAPADRAYAEFAITEAYRLAGLYAPNKIVWCGSPLSQGLTRQIIQSPAFMDCVVEAVWTTVKNNTGDGIKKEVITGYSTSPWLMDSAIIRKIVRDKIQTTVKEQMQAKFKGNISNCVWESAWSSIWESVWGNIEGGIESGIKNANTLGVKGSVIKKLQGFAGKPVRNRVWDSVRDQAWSAIRQKVSPIVRNRVWETLWNNVRVSVWDCVAVGINQSIKNGSDCIADSGYGQHDANWLAYYEYFRQACGLQEETEVLGGLTELAKTAGWFLPHENICWVSERPTAFSRNHKGQLHSCRGAALAYPDGWKVYALNGTVVTEQEASANRELSLLAK